MLRVGSGGVMLPNHPPLRVAEAFRTFEALYPGRIDLGLGRAPGSVANASRASVDNREQSAKSRGGIQIVSQSVEYWGENAAVAPASDERGAEGLQRF